MIKKKKTIQKQNIWFFITLALVVGWVINVAVPKTTMNHDMDDMRMEFLSQRDSIQKDLLPKGKYEIGRASCRERV